MEQKELNKEYNEIIIDFRKKAFLLKIEKDISEEKIEELCNDFQSNFNKKFKSKYLNDWIYFEDFISQGGIPDMRNVSIKNANLPDLFWFSKEGINIFNVLLNKNLDKLKEVGSKTNLGAMAGLIIKEYICCDLVSEDVRKEALETIIKEIKNNRMLTGSNYSNQDAKNSIFDNIKELNLPKFAEKITGRNFYVTFDNTIDIQESMKFKP